LDFKVSEERSETGLPDRLREFFWEYDFDNLSWEKDRELVVARVLQSGDWESVKWLRTRLDDETLRGWIERREGRGLSNRQLRFWELIVGVRKELVDEWIRDPSRAVWESR
jgi:uncharacterized protein DUF6922